MPSDTCDGTLDDAAAVVRRTPQFDNTLPSPGDTIFRRQFADSDVRVLAPVKEYTYYLAVPQTDPSLPFPDDLGATLIVIANSGQNTGGTAPLVGELDDVEVPTDRVDKYEVALHRPADVGGELERWGGGREGCLRYTRPTTLVGQSMLASKFIVPTWDRDCDGFFEQPCFATPPIDDDCDPLSYCDVSAVDSPGCAVPGGCLVDTPAATGCRLTACVNAANHPTKLCGTPGAFCIDDIACTMPTSCNRPLPQCIALALPADIKCTVPVLKVVRNEVKEGTLCPTMLGRVETALLANQPGPVVCTVEEAVPVLASRTFGVDF